MLENSKLYYTEGKRVIMRDPKEERDSKLISTNPVQEDLNRLSVGGKGTSYKSGRDLDDISEVF
jgi:hypothetical protein